MRKFLVCAALLCLAASHAFGQDGAAVDGDAKDKLPSFVRLGDVRAEAARLLHSESNRERAWGAYLAGQHGLKDQAPLLVELLADPSIAGGGWEEGIVRQAALDSLIRLDAETDADKLLPLYQTSPDEVIILLARSPQKNQAALLPLFVEEMPTARWLAVGNLLAETRAPGFAARLLKDLKINANVAVFDSDGPHGMNGGYGGGCGGGYGMTVRNDEFPPVSYYSLTDNAERNATVVAPGRHVIYYLSRPFPGGSHGCELRDRDNLRVEYLADLLNTSEEDLKFGAHLWREVVCKDAAQCRRAIAGVRDEISKSYDALLGRLLKESLLDPAEAGELKPDITLDIMDYRDKRMFPLPDKLRGVKISVSEVDSSAPSDEQTPAESSQDSPP
jgi:hypothetical protein